MILNNQQKVTINFDQHGNSSTVEGECDKQAFQLDKECEELVQLVQLFCSIKEPSLCVLVG